MKFPAISQGLKNTLHAIFMVVVTAVVTAAIPIVTAGQIPTQHQIMVCVGAGLAAGLTYLLKVLSPVGSSQVKTLKK